MITVGLPVRDGGQVVERAMRSVLEQTEQRFVLHVADNASVDGTDDRVTALAEGDSRIQVTLRLHDIGVVANLNALIDDARGSGRPYAALIAHDDVWLPELLAQSLDALERAPDVGIAVHGVAIEDEEGSITRRWSPHPDLASHDVVTRVRALRQGPWWFAFHGLFRLSALPEGIVYRDARWGGDAVFVFEALLAAPFAVVPDPLERYRIHGVEQKQRGDQRDIRVAKPGELLDAMRSAVDAAAVAPATAAVLHREVSRICRRIARVTRADVERRAMRRCLGEGRYASAAAHAAVVVALRPVMSLRSAMRRSR